MARRDEGRILHCDKCVIARPWSQSLCIVRFAKLVGKETVIACTDCGLRHLPDASLALAKLYALSEGAKLATRELWH
jgi:hypothetical protein